MDRELAQALEAAKAAHFDARGAVCDYAALGASPECARLAACLAALEGFDIRRAHLPSQLAFWLNVFNAAVLRDASELARATSADEVERFFERSRLKVGAHAFSLDDIQHGLLRGNVPKQHRLRAPMGRDDPRLEYVPVLFDERVHFALHSACRSSPPLRVFDGGKLDKQLEEATAAYIRGTVRVESSGAILFLPRQFRWFAGDFGDSHGIIEFVVARIDDDVLVDMVDRRHGRVKFKYAEFDWGLNRR